MKTRKTKLRVYGWQGYRFDCPPAPNGSQQTREICAAHSQVEVARIVGAKGPWALFNLCETGNEHEIKRAMSSPGVVWWAPMDVRPHDDARWTKGTREAGG